MKETTIDQTLVLCDLDSLLLDAYGRTLDNKDHGNNLIHKLLIEGRLAVKELPDTVRRK